MQAPVEIARAKVPALTWIVVALALAAGIALRLAYPGDIEWKADERWLFEQARAVLAGAPWPQFGLPTSVQGVNPPLSAWVFVALAWLSGAASPPELARAVQALNAAAPLALLLFAWRAVPAQEREPWAWAAALWAVNPLGVMFERKIWPPSLLPIFVVALVAAWWHRRSALGSFLFGLLAALLAQIHLAVALLAAALALWALMDDRRSLRWGPLIVGIALGALPALPWLMDLAQSGAGHTRLRFPIPTFWVRWLMQPFGFGAEYTLGLAQFREFLTGPIIAGAPTHMVGFLHAALAVLALGIYFRAARAVYLQGPPPARRVFIGGSPAGVLVNAVFWGYGAMLTLITVAGAGSHRHYLIPVAPMMALWVARLAAFGDGGALGRRGRLLLVGLCIAGALVSASLLRYIHVTQVIHGEYGPTWAAQETGRAPPTRALDYSPRR